MKDTYGNEHDESNGQFVSNGSTPAEQKRADEVTGYASKDTVEDIKAQERSENTIYYNNSTEISAEIEKILGKEYKNLEGQDAIKKLLKEQQGHVKGAFHREDIGSITLMWGDDGSGLKHIVNQRTKQGINIDDFVRNITDVVEKGKFVKINDKGRFECFKDGKIAVIAPQLRDGKITYLFTAYKTRKK